MLLETAGLELADVSIGIDSEEDVGGPSDCVLDSVG